MFERSPASEYYPRITPTGRPGSVTNASWQERAILLEGLLEEALGWLEGDLTDVGHNYEKFLDRATKALLGRADNG